MVLQMSKVKNKKVPELFVKGGFLREITMALLYAIRICGMAPFSVQRKENGYQFRVLRSYAVYGYLLTTFLNVTHVTSYISNVLATTHANLNILNNATTMLWITETISSVIITVVASLNGYRRIREFIEQLRSFDKTSDKIKVPRDNGMAHRSIIATVMLTRFFLDFSTIYFLISGIGMQVLLVYMYLSACIKYLFVTLLQMQIYISYVEVALKVDYINDELQGLVNNRLSDVSTRSFYTHSVNDVAKDLDDLLTSTKAVFMKMNDHFEILFFFILLNILIRIILCFYGIAYIYQNASGTNDPYWDSLPLWSFLIYGIHNFVTIFVVIQPFRVIACKLDNIKLVMGRIMTMKQYSFNVFPYIDLFHKDLLSYDFSYTPLGVMTIERSIIVKVIAIGITCLAAILQFQKP